jgi:hypothetical protein
VRKRKYERKPKPARELAIPFDEAFPGLKKLPLPHRMSVRAILLGHETVPTSEWQQPQSAADRAEARKVIDELAGESGRAQTKQQRLIARVEALRAKGEKKAVEIACAEIDVPRRTAYEWLKRR